MDQKRFDRSVECWHRTRSCSHKKTGPQRAIASPEPGADYANPEYIRTSPEYNWSHTAAELLNSLIDAGLRIDFFREWPGYKVAPGPAGAWRETKDIPSRHPTVFSLKATKG